MHRTLGIDLGTTNSVTAWLDNGVPAVLPNRHGEETTPSAVGIGIEGEVLIGKEALQWRDRKASSVITEVKRLIGRKWEDQSVQETLRARPDDAPGVRRSAAGAVEVRLGEHYLSPVQVSAVLLRGLKRDAEAAAGVSFPRAVITVPAYFAEPQIDAVRAAGQLAGFHVSRIIPEPTAAAHAFGVGPSEQTGDDYSTMLVFDLGGGTFDASLLTIGPGYFSVDQLGGDNLLGGSDFDALLDAHLRERFGGRDHDGDRDACRIRAAAELAKIDLSAREVSELTISPLGRHGGSWSGQVRRGDFEGLLAGHRRRITDIVESVLKKGDATPADVQRVLLVGGSTRIPSIRADLAELFGEKAVSHAVDPMLAVAHGAAVEAGLVDTLDCPSGSCTKESIPVGEDACPACATPLVGATTVDCPDCHVPAPELTDACPVCAGDLSALRAAAPVVGRAECPDCGRYDNPASATVCLDCDAPLPKDGLKCPSCGMTNAAGLSACSFCDGDFGTAAPQQITAQHIGLELSDGRLEVLFPEGTHYPTEWHEIDTLAVRGDSGGPVRFLLWEGPHLSSAQRNEFCGGFTHDRSTGPRTDLPLTLQVRLDADRTLDLKYRLGTDEWHGARLRRSTVAAAVARRATQLRGRYADFLETWDEELTLAERAALKAPLGDLTSLSRGEPVGRSLDDLLDSAEDTLSVCLEARNAHAAATILRNRAAGLVPEPLLSSLRLAAQALMRARTTMDADLMRAGTAKVHDLLDDIDPAVRTAIRTIRLAEQDSYQATLAKEVLASGVALQRAVKRGDKTARDTELVRLGRLAEQGRTQSANVHGSSGTGGVLPSRR
ncbi:Hsp70 family protein [Streptomyces sp. NBC_01304]|uniref:Hsp70 family protein n=1 Tax=Streptomyces sp. NBC_01304 TaxID=2903818 RepID=UPI002E1206CA|nr:Hsp70 family protein [Streptomyces sp. NBC_01304]